MGGLEAARTAPTLACTQHHGHHAGLQHGLDGAGQGDEVVQKALHREGWEKGADEG